MQLMVQVHPAKIPDDDAPKMTEPVQIRKKFIPAEDVNIVEKSPTGRFQRFNRCLGKSKPLKLKSHLGYDSEHGVEVAWNTVRLRRKESVDEKNFLLEKIQKLKLIDHPHITHLHGAWIIENGSKLVYTNDLPTSQTVSEFLMNYPICVAVLIRWCKCILQGLEYLHEGKSTPIIHGHLSCDNIYINRRNGRIRLGGLEIECFSPKASNVNKEKTENHTGKTAVENEITQFGLCVLEMIMKQNFSEDNTAEKKSVEDKVNMIKESAVKDFIRTCIYNPEPASKLLQHDIFKEQGEEEANTLCSQLFV